MILEDETQGAAAGPVTQVLALLLTLVSFIFPLYVAAYLKGDVDGDGKISLNEAIHALQVLSESRTPLSSKIINVPAEIPTIQAAIDDAEEGDTILIAAGTYNESLLTIKKKGLVQQGAGKETTIIDGGGQDGIIIEGCTGVGIKALTVQNVNHGIIAELGTAFEARDVTVQDSSGKGLLVRQNSTAVIAGTTVLRSGGEGIYVSMNSSAVFLGNVESSHNTRHGISINSTSSGVLFGATFTASNNGGRGIQAIYSSSLFSHDSAVTLTDNTNEGAAMIGGSDLQVYSGAWLIENNKGTGMTALRASSLVLDAGSSVTSRQQQRVWDFDCGNLGSGHLGTGFGGEYFRHGLSCQYGFRCRLARLRFINRQRRPGNFCR